LKEAAVRRFAHGFALFERARAERAGIGRNAAKSTRRDALYGTLYGGLMADPARALALLLILASQLPGPAPPELPVAAGQL
jgi:hypothetical protein